MVTMLLLFHPKGSHKVSVTCILNYEQKNECLARYKSRSHKILNKNSVKINEVVQSRGMIKHETRVN